MDVGAFVHLYAREFVHTDVRLALQYYFAAARLQAWPRWRCFQHTVLTPVNVLCVQ